MSLRVTEVGIFDVVCRMTPTRTKRKAVAEEHTTDCEVTSTVKDAYAIKIQSTDVNGNFVRLLNTSPDMVIYHQFYFCTETILLNKR